MTHLSIAACLSLLLLAVPEAGATLPIDRQEVVRRHNVTLRQTMKVSPTQVGNGRFAYGMDITGMQTFVPFNTLSDWGWHNSPLPEGVSIDDYTPQIIESYGRKVPYMLDDPAQTELTGWLKSNPHRVNLGRLGMILLKRDGSPAAENDLVGACQTIDLWAGTVTSRFSLEGSSVEVISVCDPERDILAFNIISPLLKEGRLGFFVEYPGWDGKSFNKFVGDRSDPSSHDSAVESLCPHAVTLSHTMDDLSYVTSLKWNGSGAAVSPKGGHRYELSGITCPDGALGLTVEFSPEVSAESAGTFAEVRARSEEAWERFWTSGAAVDLSGSTDPRWQELERRIVLSQYLMRLNESGVFPPQESGLVNNGWYGRYHWEMIWWHAAHWLLWDRQEYADGYLSIYSRFLDSARRRAASEGRKGARWPKCTGNVNREWPCDVHAFLTWQQPHPIWFAEAEYRRDPSQETLDKWGEVVVQTADYMADCVFWDGNRYVLGPPTAPVSENTDYPTTLNPVFELSYFRYGLRTALDWAGRMGLPRSRTKAWRKVLGKLAPLPLEDGMYKTAENLEDMWTRYNFEHPALTGVYGMLPGDGVDVEVFRKTFYNVLDTWQMDRCWGWDYPMLAMAAARLGDRAKAVDLLCSDAHKFAFDAHGLADVWPFPYFPANGALLTAVAMMCAGWDETSDAPSPGFPEGWSVRHEGFQRMQ